MRGRGLLTVAVVIALGGCAWIPHTRNTGAPLLDRADRLARDGSWDEAVIAYNDYLTQYPEAKGAPRATANRDTLRALLSARAELSRLREELTRLREDLNRRDGELVRVRSEADRLKADLEKLKQVDLRLERRR